MAAERAELDAQAYRLMLDQNASNDVMRRRYRSHLPPFYEGRYLFNTPGAGTSNPPVVDRVEAHGAGAPVQPRAMDPPRQNNTLPQHVPTPPGHYSNPLDNTIAAASRLAPFQLKASLQWRLKPGELESCCRRRWFSSMIIHTVVKGFIPPLAQARVTADIWMNRLCQAVRGTVTRRADITRRAVVLRLRM